MHKILLKTSLTAVTVMILAAGGCSGETQTPVTVTATPTPTATVAPTATPAPFVSEVVARYEAEDAKLNGKVSVVTMKGSQQVSGEAYVKGFENDGDSCTFTVNAPEDGFYNLIFKQQGISGEKTNFVSLDGEYIGSITVDGVMLRETPLERIYLSKGSHQVSVYKSWGWIYLDYLEITTAEPINEGMYVVSGKLSNPDASKNTKRLYNYLCDIYGKNFLSGQVCDEGPNGGEMYIVRTTTGKDPAILSMDLNGYGASRPAGQEKGKTVEYAKQWWEKGGIVEFHWHWTVDEKYCTKQWWRSFYTDSTNFNLTKALNGQDEYGYEMLLKDIDAIGAALKPLAEADIPVIFRPLHEASGAWFWWGNYGAESYKKLYYLMYDRLKEQWGLNNLIWLWNAQDPEWYVGDEYCDIVGTDIYPGEKVYTSQSSKFFELKEVSPEGKPVWLSENGCIFDPDLALRDGAMWGCWCVWQGEFVRNTNFLKLSEQYTEKYMLIKAYNHDSVITLDKLPDLKAYTAE
jgi:mannan endo-1,4-beta-mannosidase